MTSYLHLHHLRASGVEGLVDLCNLFLIVESNCRADVDVVVIHLQDRHRHLVELVGVDLAWGRNEVRPVRKTIGDTIKEDELEKS